MDESTSKCLNCDAPLTGNFCSNCGQKRQEDKERKIGHFIYQFFGSAFFLENNVFKNIWYLLFKPGLLPADYMEGKRKRHMPPLSLFLLINLIYFIVSPLTDLNLTLKDQTYQPIHGTFAKNLVEKRISERRTTFEKYSDIYNAQSTNLTKSLIILHIPTMALILAFIYFKKKIYFTDHMIFSLYSMGFILLASILGVWIVGLISEIPWLSVGWVFKVYGYMLLASILTYFFLSIRRFYRENVAWTLVKTPLVIGAFMVSHFVYRTLLFFIVFWTT